MISFPFCCLSLEHSCPAWRSPSSRGRTRTATLILDPPPPLPNGAFGKLLIVLNMLGVFIMDMALLLEVTWFCKAIRVELLVFWWKDCVV